jgi:hypothetical protein
MAELTHRNLLKKIFMRSADLTLQRTWFLLGIPPERIGHDKGVLTWLREERHRKAKKEMHICLQEVQAAGGKFSRFLTYWINERSIRCSACLNRETLLILVISQHISWKLFEIFSFKHI